MTGAGEALAGRDTSPRSLARTTGLLYLVILVFAMFAPMVRETLVVPGDAAATAGNVLGSLRLFELSLVAWIVIVVADVAISATLYFLLEPAGRVLSGVAAGLRLCYTAMLAALLPRLFDGFLLLADPMHADRFEPAELQSLALTAFESFGAGFVLALMVFGAHLVVLGAALYRSRYVPRWLGLLLVVAGTGYLLDGLGTFFVAGHGQLASGILLTPAVLGEFTLTGWLLVKGIANGGEAPTRRGPAAAAVCLLALLAAACAADAPDPAAAPATVRTDSAGIEIVLSEAAPETVPVFAAFDPAPSLRLGGPGGRPEEQFGAIVDLEPLPDGGVAVLDGQAAEVRLFDATGAHRATLGSRGDGPGEMRLPVALALVAADTLAVFDRRPRRVTRFGLDGGIGPIVTLADAAERPVLDAVFLPGGGLVTRSPWTAHPNGRFDLSPEGQYALVSDSARLTGYTPAGEPLGSRGGLPSAETVFRLERAGPGLDLFRRPAVFGRSLVLAGHPDGVWAGFNDRFELRLYDVATLAPVRLLRAPGLERSTPAAAEAAIRDHAAAAGEESPAVRRNLEGWAEASPRPARQPAYDRVVVDDRGRLWVREWSGAAPSTRWWIFSGAGELLGSADAPDGVTLYDVRCDAAWGVLTDDLDIGHVVRYAVTGPAGEDC